MSRSGMDRENFIKGQLEAVHKALTKYEQPLKPKHARRLIVGTHQERSSQVFWSAVNRVQLEKNPVLTWKFCHLLHKLLRDGHRKVPEESHRFTSRIKQLGQFWKHLNTSGYGMCNESYAKLLVDRLEFHRKFPVMPGNLNLTEAQVKTLESDLDNAFEMTISMLDEMDNLLNLQQKVFETIDCLRLSSLVPQGQCFLAPLIMVILDTSKFYDHLVKMIFKLHSQVPPDALEGHRSRFRDIFKRTKEFYEHCSTLQYFKYLVSIPTLPSVSPNFLQASDLESYRPPEAYLHAEGSEDGQSVVEDTLLDLGNTEEEEAIQQHSPPQPDQRDEQLVILQRALEDERRTKEALFTEARNRIDQYENRLAQIQADFEHARQDAEEFREERDRLAGQLAARDALRSESDDARVREANDNYRAAEERFAKMKAAYERFRTEHVSALTKLGNLSKELEASDKAKLEKDNEITSLSRKLEESAKDCQTLSSKAAGDASTVDELRTQLARADIELEELRKEIDHLKVAHKSELVQSSDRFVDEKAALEKHFFDDLRSSVMTILDLCDEDLPNATSISYPPHLAQAAIASLLSKTGHPLSSASEIVIAAHLLPGTLLACASAAYSSSIQHFDGVNEQCKAVLVEARNAFLKNPVDVSKLNDELSMLNKLIIALPVNSDVDKEAVGNEVEIEMRRMGEAIRQAVEQIEAIQRKARENSDGIRLEVNEAILASCQSLMNAIMRLVATSRELQIEIVASGKGGASPADFYKKNHQWTEGLLSAAKAVGVAAQVLVASADGVVSGQGKFEQLIVAAQEIAASTAQLFVSSRVKADKDSKNFSELSIVSREVNQCTAGVVASVKSGQTTLNEKDVLDFSHLSLHEAKKEEMESQVRMLELEQALNVERGRLRELRKQHYHMAQLVTNTKEDKDSSFELLG